MASYNILEDEEQYARMHSRHASPSVCSIDDDAALASGGSGGGRFSMQRDVSISHNSSSRSLLSALTSGGSTGSGPGAGAGAALSAKPVHSVEPMSIGGDSPRSGRPRTHSHLVAQIDADGSLVAKLRRSVRFRMFTVFGLTILLQLGNFFAFVKLASANSNHTALTWHTILASACLQTVQLFLIGVTIHLIFQRSWVMRLRDAWMLYITLILAFAGIYSLIWATSFDSLTRSSVLDNWDSTSVEWLAPRMVAIMVYMSVSTQTLVGFGDVAPRSAFCQLAAVVQMLIGALFQLYLLAQTIPAFSSGPAGEHGVFHAITARLPSIIGRVRRAFRRWLLPITLLMQGGNSLLVYFGSHNLLVFGEEKLTSSDHRLIVFSCILQAVHVFLILAVSMKFIRKANNIDLSFLVQAYLSVIVCFAGISCTLYLASGSGKTAFYMPPEFFRDVSEAPTSDVIENGIEFDSHHNHTISQVEYWPVLGEFVYFSITTITGCGYGDIVPREWYTRFVVCAEMLLSVVAGPIILGYGLSKFLQHQQVKTLLRMRMDLARNGDCEQALLDAEGHRREYLSMYGGGGSFDAPQDTG